MRYAISILAVCTAACTATTDGSGTDGQPTTTNVPTTTMDMTDGGTTTETSSTTGAPVTATATDTSPTTGTSVTATEGTATETVGSSSGDSSSSGSSGEDPSLVGTLGEGDDPCVGGDGRSWTTFGRCNARTNRTLVISAQTGEDVELMGIGSEKAALWVMGQPVFGLDSTAYVTHVWLTAIASDWSVPWTVATDVVPVVAPDGTIYTAFTGTHGSMPEVNARNTDGSVRWTRDLTGAPWPPTVLADGTLLFLGHRSEPDDLALQALEPTAGADVWSYSFGPGSILNRGSLLASSTGEVYVRTHLGQLSAIDAVTHEPRWTAAGTFAEAALDEAGGRLVTQRGVLMNNNSYIEIGTVDVATGAYEPVSTLLACGGCGPSPFALAKDGWVHFSYGGSLMGQNLDDPEATWELETSSVGTPVIGGDGTIYVAAHHDQQNLVTAVHHDGTLRWTTVLEDNVEPTSSAGTFSSIDPEGRLLVAFATNETVYRVNH